MNKCYEHTVTIAFHGKVNVVVRSDQPTLDYEKAWDAFDEIDEQDLLDGISYNTAEIDYVETEDIDPDE